MINVVDAVEAGAGPDAENGRFVPRFINGADEVAIDAGLVRCLINPTNIQGVTRSRGGALLDWIVSGEDLRRASRRPEENDH